MPRVIALLLALCVQATAMADGRWFDTGPSGEPRLVLYYFYSDTCPHCIEAQPFVAGLASRDWIELRAYEVSKNRANARLYQELAAGLGEQARSVPAFLFCGGMQTGFHTVTTTGAQLLAQLEACRADPARHLAASGGDAAGFESARQVPIPLLGSLDPEAWGLPALTLVIAGLDAFNPCAFFVLLFLLSLMIHARSRTRMLLVGGTFVFISGLVYFLFMAAWLNVFRLLGELRAVTFIAGLIAVSLAAINIKDYFWFGSGPSLSIPEAKKPGLYQRMRGLVAARSLPAMLLGTVTLAVAVNGYELLCTAGLPMVYTRILTLRETEPLVQYLYLLLYNLIYVIPLLVIVLLFVWRFGARKLGEEEGRLLKLMSGMMMLGLGGVMLFHPAALTHAGVAIGLLAAALLVAGLVHWISRRARGK